MNTKLLNNIENKHLVPINTTYLAFDILKVIFAIFVVAIHSGVIVDLCNPIVISIVSLLESCAVPVFFCISGYLLANRVFGKDKEELCYSIINIRKKTVRIYVILSIIYLPLTVYGCIRDYINGVGSIKIIYGLLRGFFLTGEQFYSWPLWYLLSFIYATIILGLLVDYLWRRERGSLIIISALFLFVAYVINVVANIVISDGTVLYYIQRIIHISVGNGRLFNGIVYMLLGYSIYDWKLCKKLTFLFLGIALAIFSMLGTVFDIKYSIVYLPAFIIVPLMIKCASHFKITSKTCLIRDYSKCTYYSHMYFIFLWTYDFRSLEEIRGGGLGCFFVAVIGVSIIWILWMVFKHRILMSKSSSNITSKNIS